MEPAHSSDPPVLDLTDKDQVKEQIKALKAGERLRVLNGDYVLTVGVPSNDEEQSRVEATEVASKESTWFD